MPQYLLEEAVEAGAGAACNIVVTQPRRISALGLAHRVSAERGEEVGSTVGYTVKMDSRRGPRTRLLFCTTGEGEGGGAAMGRGGRQCLHASALPAYLCT